MTKRARISAIALVILPFLVLVCSAQERVILVGDEELHFTPAPQRGYVVKLRETTRSIRSLSSLSELDMSQARPIRGLGRHGIWTVENEGPSNRNEQDIAKIKRQSHVAYVAPLFSSNSETVAVIPEIVIRVRPDVEMADVQRLCEAAGCTIRKPMEFTAREYLLEVLGPDAEAVFAAVEALNHYPEIEWACPNTAFRPKLCSSAVPRGHVPSRSMRITATVEDPNAPGVFPNDEYFPIQWHLHNTGQSGGTPDADINAPEAWEMTTGDPNIVVAVLDSGVETDHPDLINNIAQGYDFVDGDDSPEPGGVKPIDAHGVACAGLVAAQGNNGIGVTGVSWNCRIMPIRIATWPDPGLIASSEVASAFRWAAANGADVLSNSWAEDVVSPIIYSAIVDVTEPGGIGRDGKGCVVIAAAGNDGGPVLHPAAYAEVISIGATDHNDLRWYYSNRGSNLDLTAPSGGHLDEDWWLQNGADWMWTTDITGASGYSEWNNESGIDPEMLDYSAGGGTSSACPIAAGVAALILSVEPDLTNDEVQHFLTRSARDLGDPGWDEYYGWGRVDARAALDMVLAKRADLNDDWRVDEEDEAILMAAVDMNDLAGDIAPARKRDGVVDANDLALLTQYMGWEIPELGLIAHWKLDELEGDIAHDSALENDAVVVGNAIWQPERGALDGALHFDGLDDRIDTPLVLNPAQGSFSVLAWVRGDTPGQVIVSQSGGHDWLLTDSAGALMTDLKGSGRKAKPLSSEVVITDSEWHRVGLTWDRLKRVLCVDDAVVAEDEPGLLPDVSENLRIGAGADLAPDSFFSGLIDDIRIYDRAITPQAGRSAEPTDLFLPRIACIHWYNSTLAEKCQSFLQAYGCSVTLIRSEDILEQPLDDYDLIMIATDTPSPAVWEDDRFVAALTDTGKPILGLGEGGYRFFGKLGLAIGYPNGASSTFDSLAVVDPNNALFAKPYPVAVPEDGVLKVYGVAEKNVMIYLWPAPETVTTLASMVSDAGYFPQVAEQGHLLWGFAESPEQMTETGRHLFLNAVILTANRLLEPEAAPTP